MTKEVAEEEEKTKQLGVTKEEYAFLNVAKKYDTGLSEKDLISFAQHLAGQVKTKTFTGWQKNPRVMKDVEQKVFDACFERFSERLETEKVSSLTDELMKFVVKYNA
jgi:hypothetical protein